jgi:hypothetical protein
MPSVQNRMIKNNKPNDFSSSWNKTQTLCLAYKASLLHLKSACLSDLTLQYLGPSGNDPVYSSNRTVSFLPPGCLGEGTRPCICCPLCLECCSPDFCCSAASCQSVHLLREAFPDYESKHFLVYHCIYKIALLGV